MTFMISQSPDLTSNYYQLLAETNLLKQKKKKDKRYALHAITSQDQFIDTFIINTLNIYDFFDSLTSLINVNYIIPHPTIDYLSCLLLL